MYSDKSIKKYFNMAKDMCDLSDYTHNKVGCVLLFKNKVISKGCNKKVSHPLQRHYNQYRSNNERIYDVNKHNNFIHAEIQCINSATHNFKGDLSKCSLFIYRITKSGKVGLSKPCLACERYLQDVGIKNLYYTTDNGWCYERRENK